MRCQAAVGNELRRKLYEILIGTSSRSSEADVFQIRTFKPSGTVFIKARVDCCRWQRNIKVLVSVAIKQRSETTDVVLTLKPQL